MYEVGILIIMKYLLYLWNVLKNDIGGKMSKSASFQNNS